MSNLHEATTQGKVLVLGPVTVTKAFSRNPGAKNLFLLVSDSSVSEAKALKIWGPAGNCGVVEGQQITLTGTGPKGGIEHKEYNGKWDLNANDVTVVIAGQGQVASQETHQGASGGGGGYQTRNAQSASSGSDEKAQDLPFEEMEKRMKSYAAKQALFTRILIDEFVINQGFSAEQAIQLASGGGAGLYAQSWFLKKGH